jgi:hypothetical protein
MKHLVFLIEILSNLDDSHLQAKTTGYSGKT